MAATPMVRRPTSCRTSRPQRTRRYRTPRSRPRCRTSRSPTFQAGTPAAPTTRLGPVDGNTSLVLILLVLCYAVVSGLVKRWYVAPGLIFVLAGMVFGPFGFGLLEAGTNAGVFTVVAQLA